jgi:anti-anti-sigma regulatory factor
VEGLRLLNRAVDLARSSGRGLHLIRISPAIADLLALLEEEPEDHAFLDPVRFQEPTTVS